MYVQSGFSGLVQVLSTLNSNCCAIAFAMCLAFNKVSLAINRKVNHIQKDVGFIEIIYDVTPDRSGIVRFCVCDIIRKAVLKRHRAFKTVRFQSNESYMT